MNDKKLAFGVSGIAAGLASVVCWFVYGYLANKGMMATRSFTFLGMGPDPWSTLSHCTCALAIVFASVSFLRKERPGVRGSAFAVGVLSLLLQFIIV